MLERKQTSLGKRLTERAVQLGDCSDAKITGPQTSTKADLDVGPAGMLAVGYAYPNNLRSEIELGYRETGVDKIGSGTSTTFLAVQPTS